MTEVETVVEPNGVLNDLRMESETFVERCASLHPSIVIQPPLGASDLFVNSYLASRMSSFCVANLRNSPLLGAIRALNLNILDRNLLRSE